MADQFAFDKTPIMNDGYRIGSWRFSFRELVLGLVLGALLITCLFLAGFLGKSSSDLQQAQTGAMAAQNACKGSTCLRTSAHIMELLNTSADPCNDFYNFACGGYIVKNPVDEYTLYQTIYQQMYQQNQDLLLSILNSPTKRDTEWSSERKMKEFFASCTDDFRKEQLKGKPVLDQVLPLLGGWYVLGEASWNTGTWELNSAVKIVQTDLWLDALFAARIRPDEFASKKRIIAILPGGTGYYMSWADLAADHPPPETRQHQADYKKFMLTVAQLVARDAGLSLDDQGLKNRIEVFVTDAYEVESKLAKIAVSLDHGRDLYSGAQKVTLGDLTRATGPQLDWTEQMRYQFDQSGVRADTAVLLPYPSFPANLTAMISTLEPSSRDRKLHNYLVWRVMETFSVLLSEDYLHATRQLLVDRYGYAFSRYLDMGQVCVSWLKLHYFQTALGALYIQARFDLDNKRQVSEITEAVKTAMETMITNNNWMDQATKDYAIAKVKGARYKVAFPDFLLDQATVDAAYDSVRVNRSDLMGNILQVNQLDRQGWGRLLSEGQDLHQWTLNPYDTVLDIDWSSEDITLPAGILRFPVYDRDMPHYSSFGALGSLLGHYMHHLIDEKGRRWDKGGVYLSAQEGWWTNQTLQNYNTAKQCVADLYSNVTQGPYVSVHGLDTIVNADAADYAWEAMALTSGIRLAYNAYQARQGVEGGDGVSPALPYTAPQLFFIAHAQVHCENQDPAYSYLYKGRARQDVRVNLALKELPEFARAFQCKAWDKMVSPKPCTYY